jgi:hypothetical protein
MLLKLALALAQPALASLRARHDPLRVELQRYLLGRLRLGLRLLARHGVLVSAPELSPRLAKELASALRRAQLFGQLITARVAVELVLGLVGRPGLGHDLPGDLVEFVVDLRAGVAGDPRAVDPDHARLHQPRPIAEPEHLAEQLAQCPLVPADEARDRRVIGNQIAGDHPAGHVLATVTLDRTRGALTGGERVQHQRDHRRRLIRRAAMTVGPIGGTKRRQIDLGHGVDHKPRQMIGRQPLPHVRRQQKPLLTATRDEALRHAGMLLTRPDGPGLCDSVPGPTAAALEG